MKYVLFFLLAIACNKPPIKRCYTVINVHVVSFTPDIYLVTYVNKKDTVTLKTSSFYPVGYNTCTGFNWQIPTP